MRKDFIFVGLTGDSPKTENFYGYFSGNKIKEIFKKNLARKTPTKTDTNAHYRTFYSSIDLSGEHSIKIFYHYSIARKNSMCMGFRMGEAVIGRGLSQIATRPLSRTLTKSPRISPIFRLNSL